VKRTRSGGIMEPHPDFRSLLAVARLGTWDYDLDAGVYFGDERCRELFGVPRTESLTPEKVLEIIHPGDRQRVQKAALAARAPDGDGYYEIEYRVVWPDFSIHRVYARGQAYFSGEGESRHVARFSGVVMDLEKIKSVDARLRESEELFRTIFEHAGVGIALVDLDGRFVLTNRRLCEMLGFGCDDLEKKTYLEVTHPEDADRDLKKREDLLRGNRTSYTLEKRYIRARGDEIWANVTLSLVREADGRPKYFVKAVEDITARKKARQDLIAGEERLDLALSSILGGYWDMALNPETPSELPDEIYISPRLKATLGFADEEMPNSVTAWHARIHPADLSRIESESRTHLEGRSPFYQAEYRIRRKDETWCWIYSRGRIVRDHQGRAVRWTGVDADITLRKELEEQLKSAKETAEKANQAKSEFLGNISHELRTPMTVIVGVMELLSRQEVDSATQELLEMGLDSSERLMTLIDDLLDISAIEAGRLEIKEAPFDLRECVRRSVETFSRTAQDKGLLLRWQFAQQIPREIVGDANRLTQVLINLVGNAVKFTERGEIELVVDHEGADLLFTVKDTGIGADQEKDLFERFAQADSSHTRYHQGAGLGLSISKGLVELMGGKIGMKSERGAGSVFTFTIPFKVTKEPAPRE
jgi:two-component system, sensor histidine kinase and response regulator